MRRTPTPSDPTGGNLDAPFLTTALRRRTRAARWAAAAALVLALACGGVGLSAAWPTSPAGPSEATRTSTASTASATTPSTAPSTTSDTPSTTALTTTVSARVTDLASTLTAPCPVGYGDASPLSAQGTGTVTALPAVEDIVAPGEAIYRLDDRPVLLLRGRIPAWRDLTPWMDDGRDIAQAKRALTALGFADKADIGTSTVWNWPLSEAIADLRESAGYSRDYWLPRAMFAFAPAAVRVDSVTATLGEFLAPGTPVLTWTATAAHLTCGIETSQRAYATAEDEVPMTFADGTEASGVIVGVRTEPGIEPDQPDTLAVDIDVAAGALTSQDTGALARVTLTHTVAADVLAVPVTALVAFVDGGYGVAKTDDAGIPVYTPVQTGRFAGTLVEITGGDLAPGDHVVVTP